MEQVQWLLLELLLLVLLVLVLLQMCWSNAFCILLCYFALPPSFVLWGFSPLTLSGFLKREAVDYKIMGNLQKANGQKVYKHHVTISNTPSLICDWKVLVSFTQNWLNQHQQRWTWWTTRFHIYFFFQVGTKIQEAWIRPKVMNQQQAASAPSLGSLWC